MTHSLLRRIMTLAALLCLALFAAPAHAQAPTITSFSPTSGPVGTSVVITGTNFTGTTVVGFQNKHATSFTVNSSTQITTSVPSGAATGPVAVATPGGTAHSSGNFIVTVAAPTITSFTPTSGPIGTSVTITGTGFTGASAVTFNGTTASTYTVNSATQITATVPTGATTGTISVTTPGGTATSSTSFTVTVPAPMITSFSPTSGSVGTTVVLTGTNFTGATVVGFQGQHATSFTVNSPTQITTAVPSGAQTGPIAVATPGGTAHSSASFTVTTGGSAPAAPTNLTATPGNNEVLLSWTAPAGTVTSYNVYRGATAGGENTTPLKTGVTSTSYLDTSAANGTTYYYKVTAVNTGGESAKSNEASAAPSSALAVLSITVDTSPIPSRTTGNATVTLTNTAPSGGTVVALASSDPSVAVPDSVTVPMGQTSATFIYQAQPVLAQTSVTLTATYASMNKTVAVVVTPPIDLTAAATGSSRITLYWSGIPTATGYNIYRGMASGGPYPTLLTASPVSTPDPGPGLTNMFMYTDTGLTVGTEYFYIVRGVANGVENTQSNEDSAIPDASAVPWDAANPAAIVALFTTAINAEAYPTFDESDDTPYATQAGLTTVVGPDGVMYQGNYADNSPPAVFPPSSYVDEYGGNAVYADGTAAALSDDDSNQAGQSPNGLLSNVAPEFSISDLYSFVGNYTGIWREVLSTSGALGCIGLCGLPNVNDTNSFVMAVRTYPPGYVDSKGNSRSGQYSDSGNIYMGGQVVYTGTTTANDYALDAGLQAQANTGGLHTSGWIPFLTFPKLKHNQSGGHLVREFAAALTIPVKGGAQKGYKVSVVNEAWMQFLTPAVPRIPDRTVDLTISKPFNGTANGDILVYRTDTGSLTDATSYNNISLVAYVVGWRKSSTNNSSGNNLFEVKRVNSIAETFNNPIAGTGAELPSANGPSEVSLTDQRFLIDSSVLYGGYWGYSGDSNGVQISSRGTLYTWTSDNSLSLRSGAYPNSMVGGYGYVTWVDQNPLYWETGINLEANHTLP